MSPRTYEEEPAVSDYRRSGVGSEPDREISLSTPSILGLFFALAIVCGCIYALGFAMGRRSTPPIPVAVTDTTLAPSTGSPKPYAGQPSVADPAPNSAALATSAAPATQSSAPQTATVPLAPPVAPAAPTASVAAPAPSAAQPAPAAFMVQVAAVSSQDVADILLASLKKKGYAVAVHQEPQDKLLHVQIGPFADRKDAEAMRQRVLTDGFNAIVK